MLASADRLDILRQGSDFSNTDCGWVDFKVGSMIKLWGHCARAVRACFDRHRTYTFLALNNRFLQA